MAADRTERAQAASDSACGRVPLARGNTSAPARPGATRPGATPQGWTEVEVTLGARRSVRRATQFVETVLGGDYWFLITEARVRA